MSRRTFLSTTGWKGMRRGQSRRLFRRRMAPPHARYTGSTASCMQLRFWGTRGSIATPGLDTIRYGGNTSCIELTTDGGAHMILDCGTGARVLGNRLMADAAGPLSAA